MIRVTVELVSFGDESLKKIIGEAKIINDGTGDMYEGNYKVINTEDIKAWEDSVVKGFPRLDKSIWDLLYLSLKNVVGEKNDKT